MNKTDSLIRTKLRLPFIRPRLVPRPRLQARIWEGLAGPLTLITTPAGFGKTTLVASAVAAAQMRVAWLSIDQNDNQGDRFLHYLVAALQEVNDAIGNGAAQLMAGMQPALPEAVLTSLINDLDSAAADMALVLDDYQFIHSLAVHDEVTFLLEHCPKTFHLVIATRSDPALPLARLRARGQTVELRVTDLRFSEVEAAEFLNDIMGLHLETASVAALAERTEGWVAGLQMAALSMRDRKDVFQFIEGFSGTHRYILDYLVEEVLNSQPAEIQHFLLITSVLERLSAPLCDALLAADGKAEYGDDRTPQPQSATHSQSDSILRYLERENLFLISLDDEHTWFRYHHLFADLLQARLQQTQDGWVSRLHVQAAAWFEQNGWIAEAIHHLFAAHEMDRAADLIERYGPARLAENDPSVFQMAESLPQEILILRPKISLYQAWLFIIHGLIVKALALLNAMKREPAGLDITSGQPWMQTIVTLALAFLSRPGSAAEVEPLPDDNALEQIPAEEPILRNAADFLYGMALARRGRMDRAVEVAVRCLEREKGSGAKRIPTVAPFLTRIYLLQGYLHAAASLCREFLDPIKERNIRFIATAGGLEIDLGEALSEWNCLDEAEQHILNGLRANEPWANIMTDAFGLTALACVLVAKGDYAGAMQVVEKFEGRLQADKPPREFDEDLRTLNIRVQLAMGNIETAAHWADDIQLAEDFNLHPELYRLTLARIRLAQGRYAEAENLLRGTVPLESAGSWIARQLEANLILAAAVAGEQRLPEAIRLIDACLALAEPEGYIRIFLDVGDPVRRLLGGYLRSDAGDHKLYAQKILNAFPSSRREGSPVHQSIGLIESLTGRELEVLQLIASGKTNQDIARQLVVARGTIKAHTASIYRKLDVSNRTEAVARARQLGILS